MALVSNMGEEVMSAGAEGILDTDRVQQFYSIQWHQVGWRREGKWGLTEPRQLGE